ncbi:SmpA / OmlA family protein [Lentilactobacillus sunkii]|jgi:outer membrane protein assembly factor BamE (lipoprotein component of BamABCDE complex)|uniref:SmpA / OmlA family protein n=1 Tax=Lentilactobacillus sunkii TaxID=481719 RepID=A0A1E7X9I1_9LACO|nr:DUF3862 domain-containing protein [Lentilactobacillus sunkii]OFA09796.1 SmpA / OmlA family protein [Lentilactobacillus sunkii]
MKKVVTLGVTLLSVLALAACGNNKSSKDSSSSSAKTEQTSKKTASSAKQASSSSNKSNKANKNGSKKISAAQKKAEQKIAANAGQSKTLSKSGKNAKPVTKTGYRSVKLGSTSSAVVSALGKPAAKYTVAGNSGQKSTSYVWNVASKNFPSTTAITVGIKNGRVISKSYTGKKTSSSRTVSKAAINKLTKGASYSAVLKALGTPNAESITSSKKTLVYLTDKSKGTATAFNFNGSTLASKTASALG